MNMLASSKLRAHVFWARLGSDKKRKFSARVRIRVWMNPQLPKARSEVKTTYERGPESEPDPTKKALGLT
jgi:hypothetical protein